MNLRNNIRFAAALTIAGIMGMSGYVQAKENIVTTHHKSSPVARTTDAYGACQPGALTSAIDMDINNVRARVMTGGDMWWNIGEQVAEYEIPKGSGKSSQFAASCWIGGYDQQGQLKVAAQTYRQDGNDYWPGALDNNGKITSDTCALWDNIWKINKSTINAFIALKKSGGTPGPEYNVIMTWPSVGNNNLRYGGVLGSDGHTLLRLDPKHTYAPFVDLNGNGIYEPDLGEYPEITGDQFMWWVFNDAGNVKQQSQTAAMGIEVQTSGFAYATQDFLNNSTFYNYRVINRGALTIDSTYIAVWDDCDLGWYLDDFIGCDTARGLGIMYNGTNDDGGGGGHPVNSYGVDPPQVGLDFFQGPKRIIHRSGGKSDTTQQLGMTNFTYFNNDQSEIGNPTNGIEIYGYMTGSIRNGQRFSYDFQGPGITSRGYGSGPTSNFVFWGDPGDNSQWSECSCNNNPSDRRFIFSSGPFQLLPGAINDITFGCVWAASVGGCPKTNFKTIKSIDDQAQALFDNHFKTIEGPEAPRMVVRELDRKLLFYLVNDYGSNNFGESFGRNDVVGSANYADSLQYHQIAIKSIGVSNDSLYKFEGYRVFQLANSQVTSAEIFDPTTGEVDNTKAFEVFESDVQDGVTQLVNYSVNVNISDSTYIPSIKVNGRDSGIAHSFVLTNDEFATGSDKRFVNYQTYYFVAVAYSYNNFAPFNSKNPVQTQDQPYLASAHGGGGVDIKVVAALPNPANGDMGTILNADYGSGVIVTRIEGSGNGGNNVSLTQASEDIAVYNNRVDSAVYLLGRAPIDVKVVDPVIVPAYNWVLQLSGPSTTTAGITDTGSWKLSAYNGTTLVDEIYSEQTIGTVNEQILEKYGLSITMNQVKAPGTTQGLNNGYLTSSIVFENPDQPWLIGVQDQSDSSFANWLRSGKNYSLDHALSPMTNPCNFEDSHLDSNSSYENMLANFSLAKSTWGPYVLAAPWSPSGHSGVGSQCGFEVAYSSATQNIASFETLPDVDIVFTSDMTKWTRCAVIEEQEDPAFAQGGASKFYLRNHASWNLGLNGDNPVYAPDDTDKSMSYFPGYAIDEGTGQRLNIVFGEDSYLASDNGADMLWNPTSNEFNFYDFSVVFGGKHIVYVLGTQYDSDKVFVSDIKKATPTNTFLRLAYANMQWVGVPLLNPTTPFKPLSQGLIPTTTRLQFRVDRPYAPYVAVDTTKIASSAIKKEASNPYYTFNTSDLKPTQKSDTTNRSALLNRIYAVPNPYYGYSGYEQNRFDTRVRIINLPQKATIYIYSLDGSLIRTLSKDDPSVSYIDWDIHNSVGLPIASGMYLMDVKAEGIGETVLKWFGAMRPIDVTTY